MKKLLKLFFTIALILSLSIPVSMSLIACHTIFDPIPPPIGRLELMSARFENLHTRDFAMFYRPYYIDGFGNSMVFSFGNEIDLNDFGTSLSQLNNTFLYFETSHIRINIGDSLINGRFSFSSNAVNSGMRYDINIAFFGASLLVSGTYSFYISSARSVEVIFSAGSKSIVYYFVAEVQLRGYDICFDAVYSAFETEGFIITRVPELLGTESLMALRIDDNQEFWLFSFSDFGVITANALADAQYAIAKAYIELSEHNMALHRQANWLWYGTATAIEIFMSIVTE